MTYTLLYGTGFGMNDIPLATLEEGISGSVEIEETEIHTALYSVKVESDGNFCYAQFKPCQDYRSYVASMWIYPAPGARITFSRDSTAAYVYSLYYNSVSSAWDLYQSGDLLIAGKKTMDPYTWGLLEFVAYLGNDPFSPATKNFVQINTKANYEHDICYKSTEFRAPDLIGSTGCIQIGTNDETIYFDDLTLGRGGPLEANTPITDGYFPGDIRYTALELSAEYSTEWDPSTGDDNEATIDDVPFSESDYNSTTVDEEQDLFTFEDLDSTLRDIQFLGAWYYIWASNTVNAVYALCDSVDEQELESLGSPGTSPVYKFAAFNSNPGSTEAGGTWSSAAVNAAKIGYQSNITSGSVNVGGLLVEVGWKPKVLSTYARAGGFDVRMDIPVLTDGKWVGLLTDVAMVKDANVTGSVIALERDGTDLYVQLLEYPGYAVTRKLQAPDIDGSKSHHVRIFFHDSFISVYIDDSWVATFAADLADYSTENTVSIISDPTYGGTCAITNIEKSELYAWREGIYVEMETSGMSAIQSALQSRPVIVTADADGKIVFTYGTKRDALNTGKPIESDVVEQESPQAASDAIVYADDVFAIPNDQYDADVGWQTRVFRMFELGGDARFAAQLMNRQAIERQTVHRLQQRPDLRIQINDEVTYSDTIVSHSGETVGETIIVEGVGGSMRDGGAEQTIQGRKKVFS